MDRRTLIAITLSFGVIYGWQKLYLEPKTKAYQAYQSGIQKTAAPPAGSAPQAVTAAASSSTVAVAVAPQKATQKKSLQTKDGQVEVSNAFGVVSGWSLKDYRQHDGSQNIDLNSLSNLPGQSLVDLAFDDASLAYLRDVVGTLSDVPSGAVWSYEDPNILILRRLSTHMDSSTLDLEYSIRFKQRVPGYAFVSIQGANPEDDPEAIDRKLHLWRGEMKSETIGDFKEPKEHPAPVKYVALANRYFTLSLINQSPVDPKGLFQPLAGRAGRASLVYPVIGNELKIPLKVYYGPKEVDRLGAVDPALSELIDFGEFLSFFALPLLKILKKFYSLFENYGIAIILLTILVKTVLFPLQYKGMKSMKKMAKLQPQIKALQEKYKDDREALNREMMMLMRTQGYNPVAGCLPILIQMPIFFALYKVFYSSIELYQAPFGLWIQDLSTKDPFYVTPVILTAVMYVQQKLTPTTTADPMQAKMIQYMPVIFGVFMLTLPSGLTVYMLTNAVVSIFQQLILNKILADDGVPGSATVKA